MNKRLAVTIFSALLVVALTIVPLLFSFGSVSFSEFIGILSNKMIWNILRFTFIQALLSTAISFIVGFPMAYYFARSQNKLTKFLYYTTFIPFFLPGISMVTGFLVVYGRLGILNDILALLGLERVQILYSLSAILLGHVFYNSPIMIKVVGESLRRIPKSVLENSRVDGANGWKAFCRIEFPMIIPAIITSTILIFSYCFTSFAVVLVLGGSQYATLEVAIYMYLKLLGRPDIAITLSAVQFLFIFLFGLVVSMIEKKDSYEYEAVAFIRKLRIIGVAAIMYLAFEWFPILASFFASIFDMRKAVFIFDKLKTVFTLSVIPEIGTSIPVTVGNSLMISFATALVSVIVDFLIIWSLRGFRKGGLVVRLLSLISLSVTPSILALSYTIVYPAIPVPLAMGLLYFIISFPVAINMLYGEMAALDFAMIEAAMVDGANRLQLFHKILVPVMRDSLIGTAGVIFALSMGEFSGSLIIGGDRFPTITVAVYRLLSSRHIPEARFLSSLLVVLVISVIALLSGSFRADRLFHDERNTNNKK